MSAMIHGERAISPSYSFNEHELNIDGSTGGGTVDKLKNIRPFTESQLLSLYPVDEIDDLASCFNEYFVQVSLLRESKLHIVYGGLVYSSTV